MRHDHTSWLIHFVRDRFPEQDFPAETEDEFENLSGGELECDADAFSVLKTIIRLGGLYPGYSFRSGRTTIYGGMPAVCATEMPLYSFATYVEERGKTECVSAYGIAFLKPEFFSSGGRPVIYGLSHSNVKYVRNDPCCRIFDESILPQAEQYRYVAYSPSGGRWIDWSHEREWRWKVNNEENDYVWGMGGDGCYDAIPGLPLFLGKENNGYFSKLCIIVWTNDEAKEIIGAALEKAKKAGEDAAEEYKQLHGISGGYCGFANAITYDIANPLVQYMLNEGIASGPYDGCIHISVSGGWEPSQSMDYEECIYEAVAKVLEAELGFSVYMQSRPD